MLAARAVPGRIDRRSRSQPIEWTLGACRPAQRSRSSAPREASGASKSRAARLRASCNPNPQSLKSFARKRTFASLRPDTRRSRNQPPEFDARAEIAYGENVVFRVQDRWSLSGAVVSVSRKVEVVGNAPGGFYSSVVLTVDPSVSWTDVNCLAPGALYGDPTYDGERSPGGTLNYAARRFLMREDILPAPLFALSFSNGASVAVLDPSPRGDTTVEETKLSKRRDDRCAVPVRRARGVAGGRRPDRVRFLVSRHDEHATRGGPDAPGGTRDGSGAITRSLRAWPTATR